MYSLEAYTKLITLMVVVMDDNWLNYNSNSIRLDYSGRGMYGEECLGVVLDQHDIQVWREELQELIDERLSHDQDKDTIKLFSKLKKAIKSPKRDSMAQDMIEYYPDITIPAEFHSDLNAIIKSYT